MRNFPSAPYYRWVSASSLVFAVATAPSAQQNTTARRSTAISFLNRTAPLSFFLIVSAIPLKINRSGDFLINRELLVSLHREMHLMNLSVAADVAVFAQKRQNAAVTCGEIHFRMTDILNPFA